MFLVRFSRRIKRWFLGPKSQIQPTNFSILQRYRFKSNTMEDFLRIVEEPSQPQVEIQIDALKRKCLNTKVKIWEYARLSFSDFQKLSVEDHSFI